MARAGGKDAERLPDALAEAERSDPRGPVKVLALDYGSARTGVAVSDATGTLARPVGVVERAAARHGPRSSRGARRRARGGARHRRPAADAARRARGAGAGDGALRRRAARRRRRPGRDVRRAVHDRARAQQTGRRAPEDALAAAHLLAGLAGARAMRRRWRLVVLVVLVAVGAFAATAWLAGGGDEAAGR